MNLGRRVKRIQQWIDSVRFSMGKMFMGFEQANAFLRRIGKGSIIPILKRNGAVIGRNYDIEVTLSLIHI